MEHVIKEGLLLVDIVGPPAAIAPVVPTIPAEVYDVQRLPPSTLRRKSLPLKPR